MNREERECTIGCTDVEDGWHVYVDTPSRFASRLQGMARAWGVVPHRLGQGVEFVLPFEALRFAKPRRLTEPQRAQLTAARAARKSNHSGPAGVGGPSPTDARSAWDGP